MIKKLILKSKYIILKRKEVIRVVKMTSMVKFNENTKHAKVRDISLRIPIRIICTFYTLSYNLSLFLGIMTNSGKCVSIKVNIMQAISNLLISPSKVIPYGKREKGLSLCSKFNDYIHIICESGSMSNRNLVIYSRILTSLSFLDSNLMVMFNRYYGMTSRSVSFYKIASFDIFSNYCFTFLKSSEIQHKLVSTNRRFYSTGIKSSDVESLIRVRHWPGYLFR